MPLAAPSSVTRRADEVAGRRGGQLQVTTDPVILAAGHRRDEALSDPAVTRDLAGESAHRRESEIAGSPRARRARAGYSVGYGGTESVARDNGTQSLSLPAASCL